MRLGLSSRNGDVRVLVVDDDAPFRELVSSVLARAGYGVLQAETGEEALDGARDRPDVVLLDVNLPGLSGYEVCRELRATLGDELPIIFLSGGRVEALDRAAGLLLGADDYIVKPFEPGELLVRVRNVLRKRTVLTDVSKGPQAERLTAREREVLALLAEGLRQAEIADQLVITPKTVATHIQRILEKLGVHSRAEAVAFAHRHGLVAA